MLLLNYAHTSCIGGARETLWPYKLMLSHDAPAETYNKLSLKRGAKYLNYLWKLSHMHLSILIYCICTELLNTSERLIPFRNCLLIHKDSAPPFC
ncbi:Acyl-CoA ligase AFT1-1 [Fusarium oxysporum f. sp. albedinis]|nr:Acyl-CoA ligase AFT1-1 [Fusarium oxysporum f. sp. albedinis]